MNGRKEKGEGEFYVGVNQYCLVAKDFGQKGNLWIIKSLRSLLSSSNERPYQLARMERLRVETCGHAFKS